MGTSSIKYIAAIWGLFSFIQFCTAQQDSTTLTYNNFIKNILLHHPVAQQADLQNDYADVAWLAARGHFDPKLSSDWNDKYFESKHYYRIFSAGFQIPTWYGLSISGSFEKAEGVFLNPENTTTNNGVWALGVEANLLQGLIIDERRAALQQAKVYQQAASNQRKLILNNLLHSASTAYANWQAIFYKLQIIEESIDLAQIYRDAAREAFFNGDKPAIDTLEAFLIVQDRQILLQANIIDFLKAKQDLENYLWYNTVPLELQSTTIPEAISIASLTWPAPPTIDQLLANHPAILDKQFKKMQYEVDQKFKRDKLKPKLKIKYNPLFATQTNSIAPEFLISNYKWGASFSMPLLFRSERAAIEKTTISIKEVELDIFNKQNGLQNKIEANLEIQNVLQRQLELQQQVINNYKTLLDAETEKYRLGESAVFFINKRQEKYLDAQVKLIELMSKNQLAKLDYLFYSGRFLDFMLDSNLRN